MMDIVVKPYDDLVSENRELCEENARLRAEIDAANTQEPAGYQERQKGCFSWRPSDEQKFNKFSGEQFCSIEVRKLYARPIPAQQSPSVSDYEDVLASHRELVRELDILLNGESGAAKQASLCDLVSQVAKVVRAENAPLLVTSDKVLFNGSHGHAGYVIEEQQSPAIEWIKNHAQHPDNCDQVTSRYKKPCSCGLIEIMGSKQSPAVAVPDYDHMDAMIDELRDHIAQPPNLQSEEFIKGCLHSLDVLKCRAKTKRELLSKSPRITEQELCDIATSFYQFTYTISEWPSADQVTHWASTNGRALLDKLNGVTNETN